VNVKKNVEPVQQTSIDPFTFVSIVPMLVDVVETGLHKSVGVVFSTWTGTPLIRLPVELFAMSKNSGAISSCTQEDALEDGATVTVAVVVFVTVVYSADEVMMAAEITTAAMIIAAAMVA
jgi:hypothetical protein